MSMNVKTPASPQDTATSLRSAIFQMININKTFPVKLESVEVLKNITLNIKKGEFLVIVGPSGCGKSTLLHTLLGLEPPNSGQVFFDKMSIYDKFDEDGRSELRKNRLGIVYQQPNWVRSLSVLENTMVPLRLSGYDEEYARNKATEALRSVGMLSWGEYRPTELSSGQQQRVALARAIVTEPDVLVADEPTGNLDFKSGQMLMNLIANFNKQGVTVVMVTHDLEYMLFADRAVEMFDGKIVSENSDPRKYIEENKGRLKRGGSEIDAQFGADSSERVGAKKLKTATSNSGNIKVTVESL